jgi:ankyrin repeat protein
MPGVSGDNVFGASADNVSEITDMTSLASMGDIQDNSLYADKLPKQAVRLKVDPTKAPRWAPKRTAGNITEAAKAALSTAVQQKHHKMIEQLLDQGVPANSTSGNNLLCDAVINHDLETVRLLLLFGADANGTDSQGSTPLYAATGASYFEAAQLLIGYNANPNQSAGLYGESPFAVSLSDAKAPFAQLYLQYGADPSAIMQNGDTAFTQAMNKYTPAWLIDLMLLYSTPVDAKNGRGETALFKAINSARLDLVNKLLSAGADPNLPGPKIVLWPAVHHPAILEALLTHGADLRRAPGVLELATSTNSADAVHILLTHGADPNAKKDNIYTPLCSAIRDDRETLVETLLTAGADPNLMALDYPLFKAVSYHRTHLLPRLLAAGADPHDPKGLIESAVAHENMPALTFLLRQNIDPNARNAKGYTALTTAIRDNQPEYIDVLLDQPEYIDVLLAHGADPAIRGQDWPISMAVKRPNILAKLLPHITPAKILSGAMELAVVADQLESVRLLVKAGVSPEVKTGGVFSPLTTSIRENRKDIFRYLVDEAGADVNTPGEHLPIIKAIRRHREEDLSYIEHLCDNGADVNLMYRGYNAVLQAVENGDVEILRCLAAKGRPGPDLDVRDDSGRTIREILHERELEEEEEILTGRGKVEVAKTGVQVLSGGGKKTQRVGVKVKEFVL